MLEVLGGCGVCGRGRVHFVNFGAIIAISFKASGAVQIISERAQRNICRIPLAFRANIRLDKFQASIQSSIQSLRPV